MSDKLFAIFKSHKIVFCLWCSQTFFWKKQSHRWSESWDAYSIWLLRRDSMFASACCRRYCEVRFIWHSNSTLGHKVGKHLLHSTPDIFQLPS